MHSRFLCAVKSLLSIVLLSATSLTALAQETVIFDMDTIRHKPVEVTDPQKNKVPAGTAEVVEGKIGKAVKFTFTEGLKGAFMNAAMTPNAEFDAADGFSFWVQGDGSRSWGGIELIDNSDYKLRYGYAFPIDSKDWKQIKVRWSDLTPELTGPLVDAKSGYAPSKFGNLWFGKWNYWRDYPGHSFTIDQIALEKKIEAPAMPKVEPGLKRVRDKLKEKKFVTIVTMGDSLSDSRHNSNQQVLWSNLLAKSLHDKYKGDVQIVNPAIGGTTLSQNIVLIPRWATVESPDLVTVLFGFNDWDAGVRGDQYKAYLSLAVDRIRLATGGKADILLMTTVPAHARWETAKELEQAAKEVAAEKQCGIADVAGEFRNIGSPDEALKLGYWHADKVHLGQKGHEVLANIVQKTIETQ
jgi:lysophospholipase L1-like esterase